MWLELFLITATVAILIYRWGTKNNNFFKDKNLPFNKPVFLLGSGKDIIFRKKSVFQVLCELYNAQDDIVYGVFDGCKPLYLIRDPQLVKIIMIKEFDNFVNRNNTADNGNSNDLLLNSLFFLQNEKWRNMRNTLTPAFTGSKMRQMFKLIIKEIEKSMDYLKKEIRNGNMQENGLEMNVKDFTSRLTADIIASTAFGLQVNSLEQPDNEFYTKAQKAINFTSLQQVKLMLIELLPGVAKLLNISMFDKDFSHYFMHLVLDAMKYRVEHNIQRPDMINLLLEAKGMIPGDTPKPNSQQWSDVEVVAQCFLFFFAGMEPSSGVLSFSVHELMEHPVVQEKLYNEIEQFSEYLENEEITYEILQKMPYMDQVVSEVLRKWPVTLVTDRLCTKDFVYRANDKQLQIKKGELVRIPICAIQRDPEYYPDPENFVPERFSEENKTKIETGAYLPFGLGPRSCIGNRFAILETKAFLFHLLRDYRLEASPKTMRPFYLNKSSFQVAPEKGFWVQFIPRK